MAGDVPQGWGGHMAAGGELVHHAAAMVAPQVVADDTQHSRLSWLRVAPFSSLDFTCDTVQTLPTAMRKEPI